MGAVPEPPAPGDPLGVLPIRRLAIGATGSGKSGRFFRLITPIAKGGMGELYLSTANRPDHPEELCVIKRLLEEHKTDTDYIEMFRFEAEMMMHLDHPNIVKILDVPVIEDTQCLALEFVRGRSVGQVIDHSNEFGHPLLPAQAVLRIMICVLEGLDHVHNAKMSDGRPLGLVHRDVTPGNLLLSFVGDVKLTDFGIAKGQLSPVSTTVGIVKGKARYLAPEQILGERATPRSDLFACACVAYEMLTGFPLFEQSSVPKTLYAIVNGERPELASALPRDALPLVGAIERALSTDQTKRPQTALEFADDLREAGIKMGGPMTPADLGRFLGDLFKDARESWEDEDQLSKLVSAAKATAASSPPPPPPPTFPPPPLTKEGEPVSGTARVRAATFSEYEALEQNTNGELFVPESTTNEELKALERGGKLEAPKAPGAPLLPKELKASVSGEKVKSLSGERRLTAGERGPATDPASFRPLDDTPLEQAGLPESELEDAVTQHAAAMHVPESRPRAEQLSGVRTKIDSPPHLARREVAEPSRSKDFPKPNRVQFDDEDSVTEAKKLGSSLPVFALGLLVGIGATLAGLRFLTRVDSPTNPRTAVVAAQDPEDASIAEDASIEEPDAGMLDAAEPDASLPDAKVPDARVSDAGADEIDDKNGRLDVLFPAGARVKVDGKLLEEKVPFRGLVIGPGVRQVQIVTKNKKVRSKLNVTIVGGQKVVLDQKQLQIK